jgi:hypothetical protein
LREGAWPGAFGWAAAAASLGYIALFLLARRPVSLRFARVGGTAAAVLGLRLTLIACYPLAGAERGVMELLLLAALGLWWGARVWLLRATAEELRAQLEEACRRLFLACEEPAPGRFLLTARGDGRRLWLLSLGRWLQLVVLPRSAGHGKVSLLVGWLSKQYPGPIPGIRRVLKERKSS